MYIYARNSDFARVAQADAEEYNKRLKEIVRAQRQRFTHTVTASYEAQTTQTSSATHSHTPVHTHALAQPAGHYHHDANAPESTSTTQSSSSAHFRADAVAELDPSGRRAGVPDSPSSESSSPPIVVAIALSQSNSDLALHLPTATVEVENTSMPSVTTPEVIPVAVSAAESALDKRALALQSSNVLNVFFSAPLAWRDRANKLHPLEMLDYASERDGLVQVRKLS